MVIIYLTIFFLLEILLKKYGGSSARLFSQLFFSLVSLIFLFIGTSDHFLSEITPNKIDLYLVVTSLVMYAIVKLYLVISKDDKSLLDLSVPILILWTVSVPYILVKVLILLLVFSKDIKVVKKDVIEVGLAKLLCVLISLFYYVVVTNIFNLHLLIYLCFLLGATYMRNIAYVFLVSSIALSVGSVPVWACWLGFGVVSLRALIYILIENNLISPKVSNFRGSEVLAAIFIKLRNRKEKVLRFYSYEKKIAINTESVSYIETVRENSLASVIVFWTLIFIVTLIVSWGL